MSKSLEDLIDEDYERLDQEVYEMEELGLSNYGDRSYYIRNRDEYEKDKTISDLEAKLAESENEIKTLICDYESRITKNHELMSWLEHKNEELKQQLAEKDTKLHEYIRCALEDYNDNTKEIIELKKQLAEKEAEIKNLVLARFESETNKPVLTTTQMINQDKISFAVAELRRLKMTLYNGTALPDISVFRVIDRQIEQLTHQHEDKGE